MSKKIIISNLPLDSKIYDVNAKFFEIGDVKRSGLIKNDRKEPTGEAFVSYTSPESAVSAIEKFNGCEFNGSIIEVRADIPIEYNETAKPPKKKKKAKKNESLGSDKMEVDEEIKIEEDEIRIEEDEIKIEEDEVKMEDEEVEPAKKKSKKTKPKKIKSGEQEIIMSGRQALRVLVKNLSAEVDGTVLRDYFGKFGTVTDVKLPKCSKYSKSSIAFIEFSRRSEAKTAIEKGSGIDLFGCVITVEPAVPKDQFDKSAKKEKADTENAAEESTAKYEVVVRNCPFEAKKTDVRALFSEKCQVLTVRFPRVLGCCFIGFKRQEDVQIALDNFNSVDFMGRKISVHKALSKEAYTSKQLDDPETNVRVKNERVDPSEFNHPKASKDIQEGRTVFLSGLSFDTTERGLKSMLNQFGEVKSVYLVRNKTTEQFKGCAFAQFTNKEGADECLDAASNPSRSEDLKINYRVPVIRRATGRGEEPEKTIKPEGKDKRNLYLAREGFIRPGTIAAKQVSAKDLRLRQLRAEAKEKLLRNLHNYVSRTRLNVNNLPSEINDSKLREIFRKYAPSKARIIESKVMLQLDKIGPDGFPMSRGFGFVGFKDHEHALAALRAVNNNPDVFSINQRPVVEFAIENKNIGNLREKRLLKSKGLKPILKKKGSNLQNKPAQESKIQSFSGYTAKPGEMKAGQKIHARLGKKKRRKSKRE